MTTLLDPVYAYNTRWTYAGRFEQMLALGEREMVIFSAFHNRPGKMIFYTPGQGLCQLRKEAIERPGGKASAAWTRQIPLRVSAMAWVGEVGIVAGAADVPVL